MGNDNTTILLTSICCLVTFALPVPIISTFISIEYANESCQMVDPIGINLSNWLLGAGIGGLIAVLCLLTLMIMAIGCGSEVAGVLMAGFMILNALFNLIYSIIGSVVLFRSNMKCLNNGSDLGVMSLIVLIFYWVAFVANCCGSRARTSD